MEQLVKDFPQHISDALDIARKSDVAIKNPIRNILISGLGGSGIGGSIVRALFGEECHLPILTNNDYHLPAFANGETLVIISSYSGNTEETVSVMKQALERGCTLACVTGGGEVLELAKQHNLPHIIIPGGNPPRSMLAFSLIQLVAIFQNNGWCDKDALDRIEAAGDLLRSEQSKICELATAMAPKFAGKLPILYISAHLEPVAIRWRQQLNENSKMLCWHHVFPEMNHNELVGWEIAADNVAVALIRTSGDFSRTSYRMDVCLDIFKKKSTVTEVVARGADKVQQAFYLIHLGDWLSIELAKLNHQDPVAIHNIDLLKNKLSEI